jgi:hypothetical protein
VVKIRQAAGWYSRPDILLVGCTSQQPDGFLPLRAFKPSFSESADRGRSIIQVIISVRLLAGTADQSNVRY